MPDKVTPLWQMWRMQVCLTSDSPTAMLDQCADVLEARMKRVQERVMALPTTTGDEEFYVPYVERDAVLKILREEGVLGDES